MDCPVNRRACVCTLCVPALIDSSDFASLLGTSRCVKTYCIPCGLSMELIVSGCRSDQSDPDAAATSGQAVSRHGASGQRNYRTTHIKARLAGHHKPLAPTHKRPFLHCTLRLSDALEDVKMKKKVALW